MSTSRSEYLSLGAVSQGMADLVEDVAKFTVLVNARKRLPVSGLLIDATSVLTADHGVEKEEGIEIFIPHAGIQTGKLAGRDPGTDLALIKLEREVQPAGVYSHSTARVGMPVLMVARPEPDGHQASFGVITMVGGGLKTARGMVLDHYIATDATPYPGFSGGPLVALDGGVLGVNTSGLVGGVSLAVPIGLALSVASQLASFGRIKRGFIGIKSQKVDIPEALLHHTSGLPKTGLLVVGLEKDGPGAASGMMVGDILTGAKERLLEDHDDLMALLADDVAGKEISFKIVRGGAIMDLHVMVGER